jgi:hypothetical protein
MLSPEEFRTGSLSLPATEADEVPPDCFACPYLSYKEFSMNEAPGLFYYYCAYYTPGRLSLEHPSCLPTEL